MRVSLEDGSSGKQGSSAAKTSAKTAKAAGAPLDKKQKVKAIVAVSVIVVAGLFIAYTQGVFDSGPQGGNALEPTPEVLDQLAKQQEQEKQNMGGSRIAPQMPLGAQ